MTNRRRRKQKKSSFTGDIFRFIMAIIMIVIAVFVVAFVAGKVRGILGSMKETPEGPTRESQSELEISNEPTEAGEGFYQDEEGKTRWHISEEEGDAEDMWIPEGEALYYFNDKALEGNTFTVVAGENVVSVTFKELPPVQEYGTVRVLDDEVTGGTIEAFLEDGTKIKRTSYNLILKFWVIILSSIQKILYGALI